MIFMKTKKKRKKEKKGQKKRTKLLMHKIRILWYRGIKVLDSAAEPRVDATCDCRDFTHRCIAAKSDCRCFDITWCITRMVLFFFGQGSSSRVRNIVVWQWVSFPVNTVTTTENKTKFEKDSFIISSIQSDFGIARSSKRELIAWAEWPF